MEKDAIKEIEQKLNWDNADLSDKMKKAVCIALSILDREIIDRVLKDVYFLSVDYNLAGLCLPLNDFRNRKVIIFLSENMFEVYKKHPKFANHPIRSILHEIGHFYFGHKTKDRIESKLKHKQELEADDFADKFFRRLKID